MNKPAPWRYAAPIHQRHQFLHMADPAGDPPAPPGDPAPPTPPSDPAPPAPPADWTASLDADAKGYIEAKGFKSPADALAALKGYEPPASPDAYDIPVPEGESADFAKQVAPLFHKAGLSPPQAKALAEGWNALQAEQRTAAAAAEQAAATAASEAAKREDATLKTEWGDTYDANKEHARRAAMQFLPGADEAAKVAFVSELEAKFGYAATMKMWAAIGQGLAEHTAKGLSAPPALPAKSFYDKSNMNP